MKKFLIIFFLISSLYAQSGPTLQQVERAFRSGDFEQAAGLARQVLSSNSSSVGAHIILGVISAQRSQWTEAERHFEAVVSLAPSNPYGYFYLGQAHLYRKQWESAVRYFGSALERNYPDRTRLVIELALAETEAGQPDKALATLKKAGAPPQGSAAGQYHAVMAFALAKLNRPDSAIESMRRARERNPLNPEYWEFIISQMVQTKQLSFAVSEAIKAQKKFPDHPEIQFLFGLSSSQLGSPELTQVALRNLLEVEPNGPRGMMLQGIVHRQRGRTEEAIRALSRAARQGVPDSSLLLGLVLKDSGDLESAERELREAERLNPRNGQTQFELGKLLLQRGDKLGAQPHLEKASKYMPRAPMVHYNLVTLYRRLGEKGKAMQALQTFKRLKKETDEALAASFGRRHEDRFGPEVKADKDRPH